MPPPDQPGEKSSLAAVSRVSVAITREGPLPAPSELEAYSRIIPNGADRIMTMAERQAKHRSEMESSVLQTQIEQSRRGQLFAFLLGAMGLTFSYLLIAAGHAIAGTTLGSTIVLSLVGSFLYGRHQERTSVETKRPDIERPAKKPKR